jgi:hypothetical protein
MTDTAVPEVPAETRQMVLFANPKRGTSFMGYQAINPVSLKNWKYP